MPFVSIVLKATKHEDEYHILNLLIIIHQAYSNKYVEDA